MATRTINGQVIVEQTVLLVPITCGGCGVLFAMNEEYQQQRVKDHKSFYCPNGCSRVYYGETPQEKDLRETKARLEAEKGWAARLQEDLGAERKSHAQTKGQLTKTRKRIQAGVCPNCHRHFEDVARHMASKHGSAVG